MSEDRIGCGDVEIKIGQHEMQEIRLSGKVDFPAAQFQRDIPLFTAINPVGANAFE
jgi:hypothetical protein